MGGSLARPILAILGGGGTTGARGVRRVVSPWGSLCLSVALSPFWSSLRNKMPNKLHTKRSAVMLPMISFMLAFSCIVNG